MTQPVPKPILSAAEEDERYYTTRSFWLATYLYAQGLWLVSIRKSEEGGGRFVFSESPEREALVAAFFDDATTRVEVRRFIQAFRELSRLAEQEGLHSDESSL